MKGGGMEDLPSGVLTAILEHLPEAERACNAAALAQCSRAMKEAVKPAQLSAVVGCTPITWGAGERPSQSAVLAGGNHAPVLVGPFRRANLYSFAGHLWSDSARSLEEKDIKALGEDAVVMYAWNAEQRSFLVTVSNDFRHMNSVAEFRFDRLGPWVVQRWRQVGNRTSRRRGRLIVRVAGLAGSKADLHRRFKAMFEAAIMNETVGAASPEFEAFAGLVHRTPNAVVRWDMQRLSIRPSESTKHVPVEEQIGCLHYDARDGLTYAAGLNAALGMGATKALDQWKWLEHMEELEARKNPLR